MFLEFFSSLQEIGSMLFDHFYRGCQITSPPVVSGGFVGHVKPRGGSKNCGFALGFNPPRGFRRICWTCQTAGGGSNLTPTVKPSTAINLRNMNTSKVSGIMMFHDLLFSDHGRSWRKNWNILTRNFF